ncbi:MAG: hypothetical protein Q7K45_01070 [Nanoarchaeota archaeon]|nr:hypothetical protein [Nanoarchaeota archaeon]
MMKRVLLVIESDSRLMDTLKAIREYRVQKSPSALLPILGFEITKEDAKGDYSRSRELLPNIHLEDHFNQATCPIIPRNRLYEIIPERYKEGSDNLRSFLEGNRGRAR